MRTLPIPLLTAFALLLALGCEKDPIPTDIGELPPGDYVNVVVYDTKADTLDIATSTVFDESPAYVADRISVGRTAEYTCQSLVRWTLFARELTSTDTIVSAKLRMKVSGQYVGDPQSAFSFDVKEITSAWDGPTFSAKHFSELTVNPTPVTSFSGTLPDSAIIELDVPLELVNRWVQLDTSRGSDDPSKLYGFLLEPTSTGQIRALHGSRGSYLPQLVLFLRNGREDSVFAAGLITTYVTTQHPDLSGEPFTLHGGISYRNRLRFDLSAVPPGSIVNRVRLEFAVDSAASQFRYTPKPSIRVYEAALAQGDSTMSDYVLFEYDEDNPKVYGGGFFISVVQRWVNDAARNNGLILALDRQTSDLDKVVLENASASPDRRPRLIVTYTRKM